MEISENPFFQTQGHVQGTFKKIGMSENLVVFWKRRTQIKISYWELHLNYQEFRDEISSKEVDFSITSDICVLDTLYIMKLKKFEVEKNFFTEEEKEKEKEEKEKQKVR